MKRFLSIAFSALVSIVVFGSAASACDVQIGRPNSCDAGYRRDWANGRYGHGGPWDPNGYGRGFRRGYGYPAVYRGRPHFRRGPAFVGGGAVAVGGVSGGSFAARYYSAAAATQTRALPPSPEAVYQQQLAAGSVTKVRVPCAAGFDTLPNGNCGRWVPN